MAIEDHHEFPDQKNLTDCGGKPDEADGEKEGSRCQIGIYSSVLLSLLCYQIQQDLE